MFYLSTSIFDGQAEDAGHLRVVGEFEASLCSLSDQDFVEHKLVLLPDINAFSIAELLRGEQTAVLAQMVFVKDGGHL